MEHRRRIPALAAAAAAAVLGWTAWPELHDRPAAAAAAAPAAAGDGALLGRLVRGRPPRPIPGAVEVSVPGSPALVLAVGADGLFRASGLPRAAPLLLVARSPGLPAARVPSLRLPGQGAFDLGDLPLGPAEAVAIRVRDDRNGPCTTAAVTLHRVVEDRGLPPDSSGWRAAAFSAPPPAEAEFRGTPDGEGAVRFPAVPPGEWLLLASAPGFTTGRARVTVAEGTRRGPVEIPLRRGLVLEGRVLRADGSPAAGIRVRGHGKDWTSSVTIVTRTVEDALSGDEGGFRLEGIPRGDLDLWAETSPGAWWGLGTVRMPVTGPVERRLPPLVSLEGRILDGATGEPLPGATVVAKREHDLYAPSLAPFETTCTAGAGGAFRLEGVPARGPLSVEVAREGFLTRRWRVEEGDGASRPAQGVRLARGATLRGRVLRRDGSPVAGALVRAHPVREAAGTSWRWEVGEESRRVRSGADGGYRLEGIAPGTTLLVAEADGLLQPDLPLSLSWGGQPDTLPESLLLPVPDSGEEVRDLVLVEGARVRGTVVDGAGAPVAGLSVRAGSRPRLDDHRNRADVPDGEGVSGPTAADGSFLIEGLRAGTERFVDASGPGNLEGRSPTFDLAEGGTVSDLRITVRDLSGTIAGTVRLGDGTPAAGARVGLADEGGDWFSPGLQEEAAWAADGAGAFRVEGVRPGEYTVYAWAPGSSGLWGPRVTVTAGEVREGVDLVLPRGVAIAGRILDEEGRPIPGASVCIERVAREGEWDWEGEVEGEDGPPKHHLGSSSWGPLGPAIPVTARATATADAEGRFRQDGLVPRAYWVSAGAPGRTEAWTRAGPGDAEVELRLGRTLSIGGRVLDAATGAPVAGIPIGIDAVEDADPLERPECPNSGVDGTFLATGLTPGAYRLRFAVHGNRPELEYLETEVEAVAAGTKDLEVRLHRGLTLSGKVVDQEGDPVADLTLRLAADGVRARGSGHAIAVTGMDGRFRFGGLDPRPYRILVGTAGEFADAPGDRFVIGRTVHDLSPPMEEVLLRVERGLPIRGRVFDPPGRPALPAPRGGAGVVVVVPSGEEPLSWYEGVALSNADGAFFETRALPLGRTYDLHASRPGDFLGAVVRGVAPGASVVLRLEPALTLSGRVVDETGAPVRAGIRLEVRWDGAGRGPRIGDRLPVETLADGTFRAAGLAGGEYRIAAEGYGTEFLPMTTSETFRAGSAEAVVTLRRGASIAGRLLDARGKGVRWPRVRAEDRSYYGNGGEDGTFLLRGLPPGPTRLFAEDEERGVEVDLGVHEAPCEGLVLALPGDPRRGR